MESSDAVALLGFSAAAVVTFVAVSFYELREKSFRVGYSKDTVDSEPELPFGQSSRQTRKARQARKQKK